MPTGTELGNRNKFWSKKSFVKKRVRNKFWIKIFRSRPNLVIENGQDNFIQRKVGPKKVGTKKLVHKNDKDFFEKIV